MPEIPPAIGFLVIIVVLIGLAASAVPKKPDVSSPPPAPSSPIHSEKPAEVMTRIRSLIQQTHGNWNQVSMQDQQMMNGITGGHGASLFRMMAQEHGVAKPSKQHTKD